jgi:hypothetical protein
MMQAHRFFYLTSKPTLRSSSSSASMVSPAGLGPELCPKLCRKHLIRGDIVAFDADVTYALGLQRSRLC